MFFFLVDGVWSDWSDWTICNVTCGGGNQERDRSCIGPQYDGLDCLGDVMEQRICNTDHCPGMSDRRLYNRKINLFILLAFHCNNHEIVSLY